jgi:hypothetical protein
LLNPLKEIHVLLKKIEAMQEREKNVSFVIEAIPKSSVKYARYCTS